MPEIDSELEHQEAARDLCPKWQLRSVDQLVRAKPTVPQKGGESSDGEVEHERNDPHDPPKPNDRKIRSLAKMIGQHEQDKTSQNYIVIDRHQPAPEAIDAGQIYQVQGRDEIRRMLLSFKSSRHNCRGHYARNVIATGHSF
jgi:hypothetical protein